MKAKPLKVLIAYDGSEPSRRALDRVSTLMPKASVALVTVAAPVYRNPTYAKFADEAEKEWQQKALAEAKKRLADSGIGAHSAAPVGDEASEIVRIAEESGADLIVLGARGLTVGARSGQSAAFARATSFLALTMSASPLSCASGGAAAVRPRALSAAWFIARAWRRRAICAIGLAPHIRVAATRRRAPPPKNLERRASARWGAEPIPARPATGNDGGTADRTPGCLTRSQTGSGVSLR